MSTAIERRSLSRVMKNLNKEIQAIPGRTMRGFILAAIDVRRDMDLVPPLIPVSTGNLRQSWFTSSAYLDKDRPVLFLGFSADYAVYVHEMYGANFRRPGAGAGFFVASLNRNRDNILRTIQREASIK